VDKLKIQSKRHRSLVLVAFCLAAIGIGSDTAVATMALPHSKEQ